MHDIKIIKLGCTGHIIRMEHDRIPKKILMENSTTQDQYKNQEQDGESCLEKYITGAQNMKMEETSWG
jgi:hypothetical protein